MLLAALRSSRYRQYELLSKWTSQTVCSRIDSSIQNSNIAGSRFLSKDADQTTDEAEKRAILASNLSGQFKEDAFETSKVVAEALTPAQRVVLASTLRDQIKPEHLNDAYVEELYHSASNDGLITKGKFRDVIMAHARLTDNKSTAHPSNSALWMLCLASAIPFIGFGFLDNFIMLTVGEEIDAVFGARLGLSTLASAGLGNTVADVIGVSAAKVIEQAVKSLPFIKDPRLSRDQRAMSVVKVAKATGSMVGVMIGCCLGLIPLALSGNFFIKHA